MVLSLSPQALPQLINTPYINLFYYEYGRIQYIACRQAGGSVGNMKGP